MVKVRISGGDALQKALANMSRKVQDEVTAAVQAEAEEIEADAKGNVRVDSGDLSDAIEAQVDGMSASVAPRSGNLAGDYEKAMVNEYGKSSDPGQPYMAPAAEASRARWPKRAEEAVKRGISG